MSTRVYVGRLPYHATERDVEYFFRGYGKVNEIMLKQGYAFVEFNNYRDADDACHDLHGRDMSGCRLAVELARGTPRGRDRFGWQADSATLAGRGTEPGPGGKPKSTPYRCKVENLSSRVTWQELKDMFRGTALVIYADAHTNHKREGVVEFASEKDMRAGIKKYNRADMHGRKIKITPPPGLDERKRSKSRSSSSSSSARGDKAGKKRRRTESNKSADAKRSRSASKSKSKSPAGAARD